VAEITTRPSIEPKFKERQRTAVSPVFGVGEFQARRKT